MTRERALAFALLVLATLALFAVVVGFRWAAGWLYFAVVVLAAYRLARV